MRSFFLSILLFLLLWQPAFTMSSVNYQINWDSINTGGDDFATSTNYQLNDTLGEFAVGTSTGELYAVKAGYRAAEAWPEALGLTLRAQETATQVTYSAFSNVGKTVTVSSAGYLSVGDYIAVVENSGFSQLMAVGRVTNIATNVVTVDTWAGDNASMSASLSGGDDYVYRVGGAAVAFGTVAAGAQNVSTAMVSVSSTAVYGYSVYLQGDGLLRTGSTPIASVSDGVVSVGSEEYGMEVTGPQAVGGGTDTAVTSSQRVIGQRASPATAPSDRLGMIFKLSTTAATTPGTYGQTIYYTLTANY